VNKKILPEVIEEDQMCGNEAGELEVNPDGKSQQTKQCDSTTQKYLTVILFALRE